VLLSWPESNRSLDWLDLSFCKIDDRLFLEPSELPSRKRWDVRRLNVESTLVSDASLTIIATMPRLEELDLSQCQITDRGLESFRGHKTLKSFWLTGNAGISNQGLAILSSLPRLELVELSGTSVTEDGWKNLLSKSPRLRRKPASP
jgi:Leucine-rich repeat (LRR) protein